MGSIFSSQSLIRAACFIFQNNVIEALEVNTGFSELVNYPKAEIDVHLFESLLSEKLRNAISATYEVQDNQFSLGEHTVYKNFGHELTCED
jgi:hypothetical protein